MSYKDEDIDKLTSSHLEMSLTFAKKTKYKINEKYFFEQIFLEKIQKSKKISFHFKNQLKN